MLNENLAKIRKERGLTQEALAIKLNVVRQTVSKWEKGIAVPDADTLCRIADALEVSISALLGESEDPQQPDTKAIAKSLAQINEQMAVRNRNSAAVWKVLCLLSLPAIGFLLGKSFPLEKSSGEEAAVRLPDVVEVSGLRFSCSGEELLCSFVPSIGNEEFSYEVAFSSDGYSADRVETAHCENGSCTVALAQSRLYENVPYTVVLRIEDHGEVRNVLLTEEFRMEENGCFWTEGQ